MTDKSLKNKKIIISAGASGIGFATAKVCLSKGAIIYLCDINNKSLKKIQKHPLNNKRLFAYECDASNEYDVSYFFDKIKNIWFFKIYRMTTTRNIYIFRMIYIR